MYDTICLNVTFTFKTNANSLFTVKGVYVCIFLIIICISVLKTIKTNFFNILVCGIQPLKIL